MTQTMMTQDVLETATAELPGGDVASFPLDRLLHLITVSQFATDVLLASGGEKARLNGAHLTKVSKATSRYAETRGNPPIMPDLIPKFTLSNSAWFSRGCYLSEKK